MKKFLSTLIFAVCVLFAVSPLARAQDVWAYGGEYDYYVMDDTITWNAERTRVTVIVKNVRDGKLQDTERWNIGRVIINGVPYEWRYSTNKMTKDHDARVTDGDLADSILHICMNY